MLSDLPQLAISPFTIDSTRSLSQDTFPFKELENAQAISAKLFVELREGKGSECARTRAAYLAARSLNSAVYTYEVLSEALPASVRDVV
jgi:hypothetical protein